MCCTLVRLPKCPDIEVVFAVVEVVWRGLLLPLPLLSPPPLLC